MTNDELLSQIEFLTRRKFESIFTNCPTMIPKDMPDGRMYIFPLKFLVYGHLVDVFTASHVVITADQRINAVFSFAFSHKPSLYKKIETRLFHIMQPVSDTTISYMYVDANPYFAPDGVFESLTLDEYGIILNSFLEDFATNITGSYQQVIALQNGWI